jgi:hypothetical protein
MTSNNQEVDPYSRPRPFDSSGKPQLDYLDIQNFAYDQMSAIIAGRDNPNQLPTVARQAYDAWLWIHRHCMTDYTITMRTIAIQFCTVHQESIQRKKDARAREEATQASQARANPPLSSPQNTGFELPAIYTVATPSTAGQHSGGSITVTDAHAVTVYLEEREADAAQEGPDAKNKKPGSDKKKGRKNERSKVVRRRRMGSQKVPDSSETTAGPAGTESRSQKPNKDISQDGIPETEQAVDVDHAEHSHEIVQEGHHHVNQRSRMSKKVDQDAGPRKYQPTASVTGVTGNTRKEQARGRVFTEDEQCWGEGWIRDWEILSHEEKKQKKDKWSKEHDGKTPEWWLLGKTAFEAHFPDRQPLRNTSLKNLKQRVLKPQRERPASGAAAKYEGSGDDTRASDESPKSKAGLIGEAGPSNSRKRSRRGDDEFSEAQGEDTILRSSTSPKDGPQRQRNSQEQRSNAASRRSSVSADSRKEKRRKTGLSEPLDLPPMAGTPASNSDGFDEDLPKTPNPVTPLELAGSPNDPTQDVASVGSSPSRAIDPAYTGGGSTPIKINPSQRLKLIVKDPAIDGAK